MAGSAGSGEADLYVVGVVGSGIVRLMAGVTIRGHGCVVVVGVALRAGQRCMRARQREDRCVIECGRRPVGRGVAQGAIGGEARRDVGRIGCAGKVGLMATIAIGWKRQVVVIGVALRAGDSRVRSGEREGCVVVVEGGGRPCRGVMAGGTGSRHGRGGVWRTIG